MDLGPANHFIFKANLGNSFQLSPTTATVCATQSA
jgi:hypothetical protein